MASQLADNDRISFVVARPFTSRGKDYAIGDDFPQEDTNKIETFVRARYIIPVVEELSDKPRHWHRHIRPKAEVLERLQRDRVQLRMHEEPDSDEVVNLEVLTHPEITPEPEGEGGDVLAPEESEEEPEEAPEETTEETTEETPAGLEFDPADYTVTEVNEYLAEHPEDRDAVIAAETDGRGRKGILEA